MGNVTPLFTQEFRARVGGEVLCALEEIASFHGVSMTDVVRHALTLEKMFHDSVTVGKGWMFCIGGKEWFSAVPRRYSSEGKEGS